MLSFKMVLVHLLLRSTANRISYISLQNIFILHSVVDGQQKYMYLQAVSQQHLLDVFMGEHQSCSLGKGAKVHAIQAQHVGLTQGKPRT